MIWVSNTLSIARNAAGEPQRVIAVSLDITERKQAETALRDRERQFHALAKAAPVYLYRLLPDGTLDSITPYFYEYTGLPSGQVTSIDTGLMAGIVHPEDVESLRQAMYAAAAGRSRINAEFRLRRRDGVHRWFLMRLEPEFDSLGQFLCHYGASIEIHAQKEAQEGLREMDRRK
ncbi:MAG: PAS domain S-box protein, partial [Deltaproteobacteria bacterium]|nr:PAS domain S-box protein [Deltaproteobacteria bacterium]